MMARPKFRPTFRTRSGELLAPPGARLSPPSACARSFFAVQPATIFNDCFDNQSVNNVAGLIRRAFRVMFQECAQRRLELGVSTAPGQKRLPVRCGDHKQVFVVRIRMVGCHTFYHCLRRAFLPVETISDRSALSSAAVLIVPGPRRPALGQQRPNAARIEN